MPNSCALILLDILCGNSYILAIDSTFYRFIKLDVCRIYREKTQDRAEKPGCIFISVDGQNILSACVGAQAGLNPAVLILFQGKIYGR